MKDEEIVELDRRRANRPLGDRVILVVGPEELRVANSHSGRRTTSDRAMAAAYEALREGILLLDGATYAITQANTAAVDMLGRDRDALRALPSFLALASAEEARILRQRARARGELPPRFELAIDRPDGTGLFVEVGISGAREAPIAVLRDVTPRVRAQEAMLRVHDALELGIQERAGELRLANEALEESLRARDDFLAIASHELRTPLTPLLLQLEGMKRRLEHGTLSDGLLRESLGATIRNVTRMAALVDRLLDRSEIAQSGALVREAVDLCAVARDVVARFERDLTRQRCTLSLRCEGAITGSWDPDLVDEVLVSLISNAVKYGAGKPIDVDVTATADTARIVVRDHGIGIAKEHQARIFDRFARAVSASHYGGFGLGLWVARRAVLAHGGRLEVTSAPGEGATFLVELPRADAYARRSA